VNLTHSSQLEFESLVDVRESRLEEHATRTLPCGVSQRIRRVQFL
jgi:hypothetical protein